jgi:maltooligosyltrehalose trehalohydrolase
MRHFVDAAHGLGLGVVLDVVYNHFGASGCYWREFSDTWFARDRHTDWGDALRFDGPGSAPVREFVCANARYWIREFHLDGLRIDAIQDIHDASPEHIVAVLARTAREAAGQRSILVLGENEPQHAGVVLPPDKGGFGFDAVWNDDFHHSAVAATTGHREAYYTDTRGAPQELISAVKWGFLYQGQWYSWQKQRRGTPVLAIPARAFVTFLQNHDQIANSMRGTRIYELTTPGRYRAMAALWLLAPGTPMFFQGQEFAASTPFLYFTDLPPELVRFVREGRQKFLAQFDSLKSPEAILWLPDPGDPECFFRSRLRWEERETHAWAWRLHRDLLQLRRDDPVFAAQRSDAIHGAVLGEEAFILRYFGSPDSGDRVVVVNLGCTRVLEQVPEPLLAPPAGARWGVVWSSEHPEYGGSGVTNPDPGTGPWRLQAHATVVLSGRTHE